MVGPLTPSDFLVEEGHEKTKISLFSFADSGPLHADICREAMQDEGGEDHPVGILRNA